MAVDDKPSRREIRAEDCADPLAIAANNCMNATDELDVDDPVADPASNCIVCAGFSAAVKVINGSAAGMVPVKVPVAPAADCVASAIKVCASSPHTLATSWVYPDGGVNVMLPLTNIPHPMRILHPATVVVMDGKDGDAVF